MAQEMEKPGALAGAVGTNSEADDFTNSEHRLKSERTTSLWMMIDDIHPDDAAFIVEDCRHRAVVRSVSAEEIDAGGL